MQTRHLEAFGRTVTSTAGHLMGPGEQGHGTHYHNAMTDIHRELRRPTAQRKVFSLTQTTPTDLVRSKLSTTEIQSRAISSLPDDLLANLPKIAAPIHCSKASKLPSPKMSPEISDRTGGAAPRDPNS